MTVFLDEDPRLDGLAPEEIVYQYMQDAGYPFVPQYRFHDGSFQPKMRQWKFDFAAPEWKLAIEIEGAIWVKGRHTRGSGFIRDCVKYNTAALMGWCVIRIPTDWVRDGSYRDLVDQAVAVFRKGKGYD